MCVGVSGECLDATGSGRNSRAKQPHASSHSSRVIRERCDSLCVTLLSAAARRYPFPPVAIRRRFKLIPSGLSPVRTWLPLLWHQRLVASLRPEVEVPVRLVGIICCDAGIPWGNDLEELIKGRALCDKNNYTAFSDICPYNLKDVP